MSNPMMTRMSLANLFLPRLAHHLPRPKSATPAHEAKQPKKEGTRPADQSSLLWWTVRIQLPGGRRDWVEVRARTKSEARAAAKAKFVEYGTLTKGERLPVGAVVTVGRA